MSYEIRSAKKEDLGDVIDVCSEAFSQAGNVDRRPDFERRVKSDPDFSIIDSRILLVDGRIVSVVRIYRREMRIGRCTITSGGVGDVATLPEYQKRGYASVLLRDTVKYMRREGYDISRLGGRIAFYSRFGWVQFPDDCIEFSTERTRREDTYGYGIREMNTEEDLADVMRIHGSFNARRTYSIVRTPEYWDWNARYSDMWRRRESRLYYVAEKEKRVVGYLLASRRDERIEILEVGFEEGHEMALCALVGRTMDIASQLGLRCVFGTIPSDPDTLKLLRMGAIDFEEKEEGGRPHIMLQLINVESVFRKILPELEDRLKSFMGRDWEGIIGIESEAGEVELKISDSKIAVVKDERVDINLKLDQVTLLKMLLGRKSFKEMELAEKFGLTSEETELLDSLFPKTYPIFWPIDYV